MNSDQLLSSYQYHLPPEAIAQTPVTPRDSSKLLVVDSPTTASDRHFHQLPDYLRSGDLLVLNDTKVIPARLYGRKTTGAPVEILLLEQRQHHCWLALVKPGKRFKLGSIIEFGPENQPPTLRAEVVDRDGETGGRLLRFDLPPERSLFPILETLGHMPLPPYITQSDSTPDQYQTVYAQTQGAVAAPTAGLHFTPELLQRLHHQGVNTATLTLHVEVGTFRPVDVDHITDHRMHQEWFSVPEETADLVRETKRRGGRVFAVGTTAVRSLEGAANLQDTTGETLQGISARTNLFIYPGYQWRVVDGLITNFHLPGSSLLMLVSALVGRSRLLSLYETAIANHYRFYSFGDAMVILPEARIDRGETPPR